MNRLIMILCLMALAPTAGAAVRAVDDRGNSVELAGPAERIVSLAPHATELLFAAGAGDKLVGTVSHSDYPPAAQAVPRLGNYKRIDYERLLSLRPDLIIAWHSGNGPQMIERLRDLGLTVYVSEPRRIEDVAHSLERLGALTGTAGPAQAAAAAFRERHATLRARYADRPTLRVFYQVWNRPLMTINGEHLISQVIRLCGGRNIFAELPSLAPTISVEAVLGADPQVIVASGMGDERPEWLDAWRRWERLPAVRQDNLFFIPPQYLQRHSPRILEGAERLCAQLEEARAR